MHSTPDTNYDPHDVLEIAPDVVLVARAAADYPTLAPDAVGRPMEPHPGSGVSTASAPRVDTTFRASDVNEIPRSLSSRGHWLRTSALAFLLALGGAFATAAWERYGDEAQSMANYVPQMVATATAWLPWQRPASAAQPVAAAPQAAAADQPAADQTATAAVPAPLQADSTVPAAAAPPADSAPTLQSMTRDVANLTQQVEDLKASIAQLKATQEQLARDVAKPVEPRVSEARAVAEPRPKQLGAPPRPLGTLVHKPKPVAYPPSQAYVAPPPPPPAAAPPPVQLNPSSGQIPAQPDGETVVRPPMPVR